MNDSVPVPSRTPAGGAPPAEGSGLTSRAQFVRGAAVLGGALAGGAATWALPRLSDAAPSASQERDVLELLYLVDLTERELYSEALARGRFRGELLEYVKVVGAQERDHVGFIRGALGSPPPRPKFDFGDATSDRDAFVARAIALEDLAVSAYNGQGTNVSRKTLAAAAHRVGRGTPRRVDPQHRRRAAGAGRGRAEQDRGAGAGGSRPSRRAGGMSHVR